MGRCVALLAGLVVAQPVMAGEFVLDAEGTPDLAVFIIPKKRIVAPNEVVEHKMIVRNLGDGTAPNTRLRMTFIYQLEYVPGSTTVDGQPYPDAPGGNPFLMGVAIGDVAPGVDVVLTFQMKALATGEPQCPTELDVIVMNDTSGMKRVPTYEIPIRSGNPNLEFQKLSDMTIVAPGDIITYRLVVRNTGNGEALDVRVRDSLPQLTRYVAGSTQVNGQPVPDHLGGSPLEAGLSLGTVSAFGGSAIITLRVQVVAALPMGGKITNTARITHGSEPERPSNTVDTPFTNRPRPTVPEDPNLPHVPNTVTTIPNTGRGIVTGNPTDIVVCEDDCAPTTANIHVSTDVTRGIANTWLQVVGLGASGGATLRPSLGPSIPERLSREGLVAPGSDTVYFATFPEPGGQVDLVLSLTPKALQLVMLDQIMLRVAYQAGLNRPTALQVLQMYVRAASIPALKDALQSFGPLPAPPPVPVASDAPFMLRPASPALLEQLSFEFQTSTQSLVGLLYYPSDLAAFQNALSAVLQQPIATGHIRPVLQTFSLEDPSVQQLLDELSLVLTTRTNPAKVSFVAQRRP